MERCCHWNAVSTSFLAKKVGTMPAYPSFGTSRTSRRPFIQPKPSEHFLKVKVSISSSFGLGNLDLEIYEIASLCAKEAGLTGPGFYKLFKFCSVQPFKINMFYNVGL
jgi:hypothetical protein